jgi:hypothetical protein
MHARQFSAGQRIRLSLCQITQAAGRKGSVDGLGILSLEASQSRTMTEPSE